MGIYYNNYNFTPIRACYYDYDYDGVRLGYKFNNSGVFNNSFETTREQNNGRVVLYPEQEVFKLFSETSGGGPYVWSGTALGITPIDVEKISSDFNLTIKLKMQFNNMGIYYNGFNFLLTDPDLGTPAFRSFFIGNYPFGIGWKAAYLESQSVVGSSPFVHSDDNLYELSIAKSGNYYTYKYNINSGDFQTVIENEYFEYNDIANMIFICPSRANEQDDGVVIEIQEITFNNGFPISGVFSINDSGVEYIDAGSGNYFDKTKFNAVGEVSASVSISESGIAQTGVFSEYRHWDNYDIAGNYPFENDEDSRYLYQNISFYGDNDQTFDLFSTESVATPVASSGIPSFKDNYLDTIDLFLRWENGYCPILNSNYKGTNIGYYYNNAWHYEQENGAFGQNEFFDDLKFLGSSGERMVTTRENIPPETTEVRFTGWNIYRMKSQRSDISIEDIEGAFSEGGFGSLFIENSFRNSESGIYNIPNIIKKEHKIFNPFGN